MKNQFSTLGIGALALGVGCGMAQGQQYLLVADGSNQVIRFDYNTGQPTDVFTDPNFSGIDAPTYMVQMPDGDILAGSFDNDRVIRYDGETGWPVGNFIGPGFGGLDGPEGIEWGPDGDLYVCSWHSQSVLRYDGQSGAFINAVITGVSNPWDLAFRPDGVLFLTSFNTDRVLMYDATTFTAMGEVDLSPTSIDGPSGITVTEDGDVFVGGVISDDVIRIDASNAASQFIDSGFAGINEVVDVTALKNGNLLVSSRSTSSVVEFRSDTTNSIIRTVVQPGNDGGLGSFFTVFPYDPEVCRADVNDDHILNFDDIDAFVESFLEGCD